MQFAETWRPRGEVQTVGGPMSSDMVLLRVVDDAREGWKCMPFEEFLERIDLASWNDGQELIGMVLPQRPAKMLH
jgi:hypothetical protein